MPVSGTPTAAMRSDQTVPQLLDDPAEVRHLADRIRALGLMGLDTEFISEGTYTPQLALVQVATADGIYLIDPLAERERSPDQPIWDAMADPQVRTIVHDYYQESLFCLERAGRQPGDLFDLQLAAAFNGYHYKIAYDQLVRRELGVKLGPSQSRTNWLQRPLTVPQRQYAADDVRWMIPIHDRFMDQMSEAASGTIGSSGSSGSSGQQFDWLQEETATLLVNLGAQKIDRWRKLSGANKLSARSRAALRELSAWREATAKDRDRPRRRIASDDLLVAIAASRPSNEAELLSVRAANQLLRQDRSAILDALATADTLSDSALPPRGTPSAASKPPRMLLLFLETVLSAACARYQIDPSLVGSSSQLRTLLAWNASGRPSAQTPPLLRGWRGQVCAKPLLRALNGEISLKIDDPHAEQPLTVAGLIEPSG